MRNSFGVSQVWECGFDGPYNAEHAIPFVTQKVNSGPCKAAPWKSRAEFVELQRNEGRFRQSVLDRAEMLKESFGKIDRDGDGHLNFDEFSCGLKALGIKLPKREIELIWQQQQDDNMHAPDRQSCLTNENQRNHNPHPSFGKKPTMADCLSLTPHPDSVPDQAGETASVSGKYTSIEEKRQLKSKRNFREQLMLRAHDIKSKFLASNCGKSGQVEFADFKANLWGAGIILSEEDFYHAWDSVWSNGPHSASRIPQHGERMPLKQLEHFIDSASRVRSYIDEPCIHDREKTVKLARSSSLIHHKLARHLAERGPQLARALRVADERASGALPAHEFAECLRAAGILLSGDDCAALLDDMPRPPHDPSLVDYTAFLSSAEQAHAPPPSPHPPAHRSSATSPILPDEAADGGPARLTLAQAKLERRLRDRDRAVRAAFPPGAAPSEREFRSVLAGLGLQLSDADAGHLYLKAAGPGGVLICDRLLGTPGPAAPPGSEGASSTLSGPSGACWAINEREAGGAGAGGGGTEGVVSRVARSRASNRHRLLALLRRGGGAPQADRVPAEQFVQRLTAAVADVSRAEAIRCAAELCDAEGLVDCAAFAERVHAVASAAAAAAVAAADGDHGGHAWGESGRYGTPDYASCGAGDGSDQAESAWRGGGPAAVSAGPGHAPPRLAFGRTAVDRRGAEGRAGWIEGVVRNSMRDLNRFEAQRKQALSRPADSGPARILHLAEHPPLRCSPADDF